MSKAAKYAGPNSAPLGALGNEAKLEPGGGARRLQVLLCGLEAASILLAIMSSPGIDRRAVEDDTIEACVTLIKNHIQKHLLAALSNTGHLGMTRSSPAAIPQEDENDTPTPKAKRTKTTHPNKGTIAKGLKSIYAYILNTVGIFGIIMERTQAFIVVNEMDDQLLFTLSAAALSSLTIDASPVVRADTGSLASIVHIFAMDLIAAVFGRYPRHRSIIVEDMFPLMLKLPSSKRSLRTYLVKKGAATPWPNGSRSVSSGMCAKKEHGASASGDHVCIQPLCALTLLLIQSCVVMPFQSGEDIIEEGNADAYDEEGQEKEDMDEQLAAKASDIAGLEGCVAVCNQFTSQMLMRCSRKGGDGGASEFRPILSNLIDDLLIVRYSIEFPAVEMLLHHLSHRVSH